jgi:hypothetical protein
VPGTVGLVLLATAGAAGGVRVEVVVDSAETCHNGAAEDNPVDSVEMVEGHRSNEGKGALDGLDNLGPWAVDRLKNNGRHRLKCDEVLVDSLLCRWPGEAGCTW